MRAINEEPLLKTTIRRSILLIPLILTAILPATLWAANPTVPGTLSFPNPTLENISVLWLISGDDNLNGVVSVRYRKTGDATWRTGMPLRRVPAGTNPDNGWTWPNRHAGSVFDLTPGTSYDIELTLTDPDGGSTARTQSVATRPVPVPMPGGPVKPVTPATFAAQAAGAQPGDILDLAAGTYPGFTFPRDGSSGKPIVIRSTSGAVITGLVDLDGRQWVYLDGLTINGRISMEESSYMAVTKCTVTIPAGAPETDESSGIVFRGRSENNYIADNVVTGIAPWQEDMLGCCTAPFKGEGIEFSGPGHVVMNNRVKGFRDNISTMEEDEAIDQWSIDILNNDIIEAVDDGVEADYCLHNCRIMRNRLTNTFMGLSSQPGIGGPTYFIRNAMYNQILEAFKLHNGTTGDVLLHNTAVKSGDAFGVYSGAPISRTFSRNNLFLGGPGWSGAVWGTGDGKVISLDDADGTLDLNYDGYGSQDGTFRGRIGSTSFSSLAQLKSLTTEKSAVQLSLGVFASTVTHPQNPFPARAIPDLRIAAGSAAENAAILIPGINDNFLGSGPDLGAYEAGAALPVYGPRSIAATPTLTIQDVSHQEGNAGATAVTVTIRLSAPSTSAVAVEYGTADGTASAVPSAAEKPAEPAGSKQ